MDGQGLEWGKPGVGVGGGVVQRGSFAWPFLKPGFPGAGFHPPARGDSLSRMSRGTHTGCLTVNVPLAVPEEEPDSDSQPSPRPPVRFLAPGPGERLSEAQFVAILHSHICLKGVFKGQ